MQVRGFGSSIGWLVRKCLVSYLFRQTVNQSQYAGRPNIFSWSITTKVQQYKLSIILTSPIAVPQ